MTLREYISFWQETYDKHQSRPTTYAAHNYVFKNHILPGLGDIPLSELTSEMVGEFLEERKRFGNHRRSGFGLGEETMRHIHRLLQQCLDQTIRDGLLTENPAKAFRYRKSTTVKANIMTPLEMEDYLDAAERLGYLPMFMLALTTGLRYNTAKGYEGIIEHHIIPAIGAIKLKQLSSIHIQRMYNDLKENGRMPRGAKQNDKPLSNTFVRRVHAVLQAALKQAVKERLIPYTPCENCRIPHKDKKEMTILPPEKIGRYLQEAEKYGVLPMFYLELSSGLRRGELLALQWEDLNVKERILTVNKQVTRMEGELDVTEPKTKNSVRKVALSQQAVDLLVQEHEQHPDNPILFPSPRTGGYWSPDAVSRINRKLLKNAGIEEHVRFHDLRHTFATMAISSGVDVKTLSSMLGHYSAGFTLDTYTHITNDMQRGAAEKIGGFMESATATTTPEPPDPPEESRCKVIPFEKVG